MNINNLKQAIKNSGLTRKVIAERAGITSKTYDNVLKGIDAKVSTIEALARVLRVPVGYFFDEGESGTHVHTEGDNSPATGRGNITISDPGQVELLQKLLDEKERVIALYERLNGLQK